MNVLELCSRIKRSPLADVPIALRLRLGFYDSDAIDRDVEYAIGIAENYLSSLVALKMAIPGVRVLELGPGLNFAPLLALSSVGVKAVAANHFLANWNDA